MPLCRTERILQRLRMKQFRDSRTGANTGEPEITQETNTYYMEFLGTTAVTHIFFALPKGMYVPRSCCN